MSQVAGRSEDSFGISPAGNDKAGQESASAPRSPSSGQTSNSRTPEERPRNSVPSALDARAQTVLLQEAFRTPQGPPASVPQPEAETAPAKTHPIATQWLGRALKTAAGLAVITAAGWSPVQRLLALSSSEAVVNARLVTLRAPLDGRIITPALPRVGATTEEGAAIMEIRNPRADRTRLDDLRRIVNQLEIERPAIVARLERLRQLQAEMTEQAHTFQLGRIRELEMRVLETKSAIAGAAATHAEATATAQRLASLFAGGTASAAALDRARRDEAVAAEAESALSHRLAATEVELDAARRGSYVGDSYNDRPSSVQQADELTIRTTELEADLRARDARLGQLKTDLDAESARYAELSEAELIAPVRGDVWEVLVSAGEEVRRGQDLIRILDCTGAVVTASVSESVYNRLHIGDGATFRFAGDGVDHRGHVTRLSGLAAPSDNLAIGSSTLINGGYRVVVAVPDVVGPSCAVGRTGRVVFEPADAGHGQGLLSRLVGSAGEP